MLTVSLDISCASDLASVLMDIEREAENSTPAIVKAKDPEKLARLVIREGKPFRTSALECGYSQSIADKGLNYIAARSSAVSTAVERESARLTAQMNDVVRLKPLAIARLHTEISDLRRPGGLKAIEIAGRLKELDWFVRNVDVQVGVFASFADASPDPAADSLDTYKNED